MHQRRPRACDQGPDVALIATGWKDFRLVTILVSLGHRFSKLAHYRRHTSDRIDAPNSKAAASGHEVTLLGHHVPRIQPEFAKESLADFMRNETKS